MEEQMESIPLRPFPWRRFFARGLDYSIYYLVWLMFLVFTQNTDILSRNILDRIVDTIMALVLMMAAEPMLVTVLKTTIGKAIFGIQVVNKEGARLVYWQSLYRTWMVICWGYALCIPFLNMICLCLGYVQCIEGKEIYWDAYSKVLLKDRQRWRIVLYIIMMAIVFTAIYYCVAYYAGGDAIWRHIVDALPQNQ